VRSDLKSPKECDLKYCKREREREREKEREKERKREREFPNL